MKNAVIFFVALCLVLFPAHNILAQQFGSYTFVPLAGNPHDVVYDSSRNLAYVSNRSLDRIDIISLATQTVQGNIPVGDMPMGLAITPDFSQLLVTLYTPRQMAVVDLNTRTTIRTIILPTGRSRNHPLRVDFDSAGACFWRDGSGDNPYGWMYNLNLGTNVSTRLFPDKDDLRYEYSYDRTKCLYGFDGGKAAFYDATTNSMSNIVQLPGFGPNWWDWNVGGIINNAGDKIIITQSNEKIYIFDALFNVMGMVPVGFGWGTFGPWRDIAVFVEVQGGTSSNRISLIDTTSISIIDTLTLPEPIGGPVADDYDYGSQPITLNGDAKYLFAVGLTGLYIIEMSHPIPISLEILGPDEVAENSTVSFKAIAHYEDDSTRDVTASAAWSVIPNDHAAFDAAGKLTTNDLEKFQNVVVTAQYAAQGVTVQADKTVTVYAICPTGYALQFDGQDDYVSAGSIPALKTDDNFTWSFWVWLKANNNSDDIIVGNRKSYAGNHFIKFTPTHFEYYSGSPDGTMSYSIPTERWLNIAVVKNGSTLTYYSDGNIVANKTVTRDITSNPFYFGGDPLNPYGQTEYAACILDEVQLWQKALTQQEIQTKMHQRLQGNEPGIIAYWDFDEGSGQVVHDLSPNGNNGQLGSTADADSGDPLWVASDAPVGVCTPYVIAVQNIKTALAKKLQMLTDLESSFENEQKAIDALRDLLADGDLGGLKRTDVLKSMADIRLAMVQQHVSRLALRRGVMRLEDSLRQLGVAVEPHHWPETPDPVVYNPADINMDGQVNLFDLTILGENWNQSK